MEDDGVGDGMPDGGRWWEGGMGEGRWWRGRIRKVRGSGRWKGNWVGDWTGEGGRRDEGGWKVDKM